MIGNNLVRLEKVDSTNSYLKKILKEQKPCEGTIVIADEQISGRGQRDNSWESKVGENLTFSFILYPLFLSAGEQFLLSKFVALATYELLGKYLEDVKIKWPNDIYVGKKKIAGILIENVLMGAKISNSIIGIGLNVNQHQFSSNIPFATSLKMETGNVYNLEKVLLELMDLLNLRYNLLIEGNSRQIDTDYINALYQYNQMHTYKAADKIFKAKIVGIENSGMLRMITQENEPKLFAFKEVQFL